MVQALTGKPDDTLEVPAGLTEVRVAKSDGRLTRKKGDASLPEWVRQEDAQAPEGPAPTGETREFVTEDPGYYERPKRPAPSGPPSGAPRLIDDLF